MAKAEATAVLARARSGGAEITLGVGGPEGLRELAHLSEAEFGFLPDRSSEEYYRWQYYDNPAGRVIVASAWSLGELVGHYAVVPVRVFVEGRETTAGIGVNAITKKEFQGRAVFARLVVLAEQAAKRSGIDFHYVVPSPESHPWFVRLLRYRVWESLPLWVRPLRSASLVRSLGAAGRSIAGLMQVADVALAPMLNLMRSRANPAALAIRPMPGFPSEMDALWKQGRSRFRFCVARTADYLQWRFQAVPTRQYRIWGAYAEGRLVAYIVVRIREIRQRPGLRVGVIADLFGRTDGMGRSGAKLLVSTALQWLSTEGADGCMVQLVSPVLRPALWSNGFFRLPKIFSAERQLLIRYPGAAQAAAPDGLGLHFVGGDHDMG